MTKGFGIKQSKYYQKYGIIATTGRTRDKLPVHKHRASVKTAGGKKRNLGSTAGRSLNLESIRTPGEKRKKKTLARHPSDTTPIHRPMSGAE